MPNSTGVWRTSGGRSLLRSDEISMADFFRRGGYATGIFGKWHLGDNAPYRPQDRGFETVVVHGGGGVGQTPDYWGNCYFDDSYWNGERYRQFDGYCTDVWFREALTLSSQTVTGPSSATFPPMLRIRPPVEPRYSDPYLPLTPTGVGPTTTGWWPISTRMSAGCGASSRSWACGDTVFVVMTDNGSAGGVEVDEEQYVVSGFNAGMRGKKASE